MESIFRALDDAAEARRFFLETVEPLCDRFDRPGVDEYVALFAQLPECDAARYRRIRMPRPCETDAADVVVLSRVTLGADVAVTSVVLDAARRRFPRARLWLAGPRKSYELFEGAKGIGHIPVEYHRHATLRERLRAAASMNLPESAIVLDPDSRLTQLGLVPVCPEENYYFFESRSAGGDGDASLPTLTAEWCQEVLGVTGCAWILPADPLPAADVCLSFGVGENDAKRVADPFERDLVQALAARGLSILIDTGAGGVEAERACRAAEGTKATLHAGAFAPFAGAVAASNLFIGYDSAGGHVASAAGTPLISVAKGFTNARMAARWRPQGEVVAADEKSAEAVLTELLALMNSGHGAS